MPATRFSVLDAKPATELRPGETGLRLKDDPYYGKVDLGPVPTTTSVAEVEEKEKARIAQLPADQRPAAEEKLGRDLAKRRAASKKGGDPLDPHAMPADASLADQRVMLGYLEESIESGVHVLDGEEQAHVEVLTGKRLQQRPPVDLPRPQEDVIEPLAGEAGARAVSKGSALEPPERERDKTRAAKPGESAKS
jgi:hypothetical protein